MAADYTHLNLVDVEDAAPGNGFDDRWEARGGAGPAGGTGHRSLRTSVGSSPGSGARSRTVTPRREETYVIVGGYRPREARR